MHFLYSLLTAAGMLALLPYFLVKGLREGKYLHSVRQRMGFLPCEMAATCAGGNVIWLHAVSVGEVVAALPLARRLKDSYPQHRLLVSTTTATGQQLARQRLSFADGIFYFPLDWVNVVRRVLRVVRPSLVIILETEIWPNFLSETRRAGVPVIFVNGRVSENSFARYQSVLKWSGALEGFLRTVLGDASLFLMQSEEDAQRLRTLGAPEARVEVTGNLKYDLAPPAETSIASWLGEQIERQERWPIVVAGSVVAGEEEHVLGAFDLVQRKWCRALLVLAPRKPECFGEATHIVVRDGFQCVRRSTIEPGAVLDENADVFLLDSVGELAGLYRLADVTFIGGSLVHSGGHNILEPALYGKVPVFGPSMENFSEMARLFLENMAGLQVWNVGQLAEAWEGLISNDERRERMGRAARAVLDRSRGATERSFARVGTFLTSSARAAGSGGAA